MIRVTMSNEHTIDFQSEKMKNHGKSPEPDVGESSTINRLPDEIILQILNKLIDLKTLCFCYLVSTRFSSIVVQVGAISFTPSSLSPRIPDKSTDGYVFGESFQSASRFLSKFKGVKSLSIELLSSSDRATGLFKWKVKIGPRIESFIFLSAASICDKDESSRNGNGLEEEANQQLTRDMFNKELSTSLKCLEDVVVWHRMLLNIVKDLPLLEEFSITDSGRRGRLSLSGEKLNQVKEWVKAASESEMNDVKVPDVVRFGYIPVLKLPDSGCMMKGVYCGVLEMKDIQGGYDFLKKSENGFENDKEDAAYTEAMIEILEKHKGMMHTGHVPLSIRYEASSSNN